MSLIWPSLPRALPVEIATLAGMSIGYYTRLERGRETRPGPAAAGGTVGTHECFPVSCYPFGAA